MSKEVILALDKKLSSQRIEWTNNIKELAQSLRRLNELEGTIAEVLSSRQSLVEQISYLNMKIKEQKNSYEHQLLNTTLEITEEERIKIAL